MHKKTGVLASPTGMGVLKNMYLIPAKIFEMLLGVH